MKVTTKTETFATLRCLQEGCKETRLIPSSQLAEIMRGAHSIYSFCPLHDEGCERDRHWWKKEQT